MTDSILNAEPEPPTTLRTAVPIELDRIVEKALAKARVKGTRTLRSGMTVSAGFRARGGGTLVLIAQNSFSLGGVPCGIH